MCYLIPGDRIDLLAYRQYTLDRARKKYIRVLTVPHRHYLVHGERTLPQQQQSSGGSGGSGGSGSGGGGVRCIDLYSDFGGFDEKGFIYPLHTPASFLVSPEFILTGIYTPA